LGYFSLKAQGQENTEISALAVRKNGIPAMHPDFVLAVDVRCAI